MKTGTRFSLQDKRLFEISRFEITRVDCIHFESGPLLSAYRIIRYFIMYQQTVSPWTEDVQVELDLYFAHAQR